MPFYEEFGHNEGADPIQEINLTGNFSIPDNLADVFFFVEGRILAPTIQWIKVDDKKLACLPINPGEQWHIKVWRDTQAQQMPPQQVQQKHQARQIIRAQPTKEYEMPDDFAASAFSDPQIQKIFDKNQPPGGYLSDKKRDDRGGHQNGYSDGYRGYSDGYR